MKENRMTRVLLTGATGKMGLEAVKTIFSEKDLQLVGCIGNSRFIGEDIGLIAGIGKIGVIISADLTNELETKKPDIVVDLTHGEAAVKIIAEVLAKGINCITGSTGFSEEELTEIKKLTLEKGLTTMVIPNFSVGAVLMTLLAQKAANYFEHAEIIEMHHEAKKDSPSGTAIKTAEMLYQINPELNQKLPSSPFEKIAGVRGGVLANVNIHSIRMPGFVASQEVIFGGLGQTLTIRHDTINRQAFMPGIILCIRKMQDYKGFIYGLETLLS